MLFARSTGSFESVQRETKVACASCGGSLPGLLCQRHAVDVPPITRIGLLSTMAVS